MGDKSQIKRLSIARRVDLIFAFFRDALTQRVPLKDMPEQEALLRREVRRQIENAVRDAFDAQVWPKFEFTDEELCPACGVPVDLHGTITVGKWNVRVCAGVSGANLFIIGQDAAAAFVETLKEKDGARESEPTPEVRGE